ncbi:MAG: DUF1566 domain-containing protein [Steroidobacteraceae bacterium]
MSKPSATRRHRVAALAAGFIGLTLATAAGAVDLRDWGRKFPAAERFVVLSQFGKQAVLDKETQLVWQRTPALTTTTWSSAKGHCIGLVLGGRLGWRLPSLYELLSIGQSNAPAGNLGLPPGHPFKSVQTLYWTSTARLPNSGQPATEAFLAHIGPGNASAVTPFLGQIHFGVWCVRGGGMPSE